MAGHQYAGGWLVPVCIDTYFQYIPVTIDLTVKEVALQSGAGCHGDGLGTLIVEEEDNERDLESMKDFSSSFSLGTPVVVLGL